MIPGHTFIIECPNCKQEIEDETVKSCNNMGAETWSDGRVFAPMWPDYPPFVKCPNCSNLFWKKEAKVLGKVPGVKLPRPEHKKDTTSTVGQRRKQPYKCSNPILESLCSKVESDIREYESNTALPYMFPNEDDYLNYLVENGDLSTKKEFYIRRRAWWCSNDRVRDKIFGRIRAHIKIEKWNESSSN